MCKTTCTENLLLFLLRLRLNKTDWCHCYQWDHYEKLPPEFTCTKLAKSVASLKQQLQGSDVHAGGERPFLEVCTPSVISYYIPFRPRTWLFFLSLLFVPKMKKLLILARNLEFTENLEVFSYCLFPPLHCISL